MTLLQESAMLVEEAHKQFYDYFEPIVKEAKSKFVCIFVLDQAKSNPSM